MSLFDPSRYTHNLSGNIGRRSRSLPIPVSFSDQSFIDQVAETTRIFSIQKRVLPGPVMKTEDGAGTWEGKKGRSELSCVIRERKKEMKKKELIERPALLGGERKLWGSEDWRERNKDLNQAFLKLSPIRSGRKISRGKGESFVLNS